MLLGLLAVVAVALGAEADHPECDHVVGTTDTIQAAIDAAVSGETVCVGDAAYEEALSVNKQDLTLRRHNTTDHPVVQNTGTLETGMVVSESGVTVQGINVTGFTGNGINVTDHNVTILEANVSDNAEIGIIFDGVSPEDGVVRDSKVSGNDGFYAIRIDSADRVKVEDSNVSSNGADGISVSQSQDVTIANNTAQANDHGIRVASDTGALVDNNTVTANAFDGIDVRSSAHSTVLRDNTVSDNTESAVVVDSSDDVTVTGLTATGNGAWVLDVASASNLRVTGATITGNSDRAATVQNSDNLTLEDSLIDSNDRVHIRTTPDAVVANNTISNATGTGGEGIFLDDAARARLENNEVVDNDANGVEVRSSDDAVLRDNVARGNGVDGVLVWDGSARVTIRSNELAANSDDGIELNSAPNATVASNTVSDNIDEGIHVLLSSHDAVIADNTVLSAADNAVRIEDSDRVAVTGNNASESVDDAIILINVPGGTVANNTVLDPGAEGIDLDGSSHESEVRDNLVNGSTEHGVTVESDDVLIVDNVVRDSGFNGILFEAGATNNTVRDTTVTLSGLWDLNTTGSGVNSAERLDVGDSTKPDTKLSFEARSASVRGNASSQPSNPDAEAIGRYFDAIDNAADAYVDISVHYTDSDVSDVDESTLAIWNLSGGDWVELPSTVDAGANTVSSNVTGFSPFGAFSKEDTGGGGPSPSPDFVVTAATVSATEVTVGENVTVTATVKNKGDAAGTQGVGFRMDDGVIRSVSLHLDAGETGTVSLTHAYDDTGTYHVSVQGVDAGVVTVEPVGGPAQPDIRVTQPSLSPTSVTVGESAEACATLENRGGATGTTNVQVTLDGQTVGTEQVTVAADGQETVCRSFTPSEASEFEVEVNGALAGTLVVQAAEDGGGDGETVPGFGPVAAALSLVVAWRIVERRR